jgi:hypothetical protein
VRLGFDHQEIIRTVLASVLGDKAREEVNPQAARGMRVIHCRFQRTEHEPPPNVTGLQLRGFIQSAVGRGYPLPRGTNFNHA